MLQIMDVTFFSFWGGEGVFDVAPYTDPHMLSDGN